MKVPRQSLLISLTALSCLLAIPGESKAIELGSRVVRLQEITAGLGGATHVAPTDLVPFPDASGRLAVSTINGVVRITDSNGSYLDSEASPFLDTRSEPNRFINSFYSFGMTGIAFHPNFADSAAAGYGKFYTIVTEHHFQTPSSNGSLPDLFDGLPLSSNAHHDVLVEWTASDATSNSPTFSRRNVLAMEQPHENHNVTDLAFGPDGLLYLASGDGGNPSRFTAPQDVTTYIGKMMRIDPLSPSATGVRHTTGGFINSSNGAYRIPTTNPGVGIPIEVDEVFAYGFRSPFRLNFDSATGDLYVGDVGEGRFEEVSIVTLGGNYGWGRFEGTFERDPNLVLADGTTHTPPIFQYGHGDGETVIGGFVYRGSAIPELDGKYIFADFGRQVAAGQVPTPARLFAGDPATGQIEELAISLLGEQLLEEDAGGNIKSRQFILSIGQDLAGELYLVVGDDPQFLGTALETDGRILKIAAAPAIGDLNLDGDVDRDDWAIFRSGIRQDLSGLSLADAYLMGDLDGDGFNNAVDFRLFKDAFNAANGTAAFAQMASEVPEPPAWCTQMIAMVGLVWWWRRKEHGQWFA
jgi:hypothetical protein